jgi:hypothetical protein
MALFWTEIVEVCAVRGILRFCTSFCVVLALQRVLELLASDKGIATLVHKCWLIK